MDIARWLRSLGLDRYERAFLENDVTVEVLPDLTVEDLKHLGVATIGHRRRLLAAIAVLQGTRSPYSAGPSGGERAAISATERRHITVLFCDIVGSTPLARGLDPEDLREVLTTYQTSVGAAVARYKGYVARFVGDGVLAYFGWPNADEAHTESAVRAGLAIVEAIRSQQLSVRIGVATGLVVTGDLVGVGAAQTVTAVGETPHLAARLQTLAQPDTVVVSEATQSQLGQMFDLEDLGGIVLKGFDKPVRAWCVRGRTSAASRSETLYAGTVAHLVGRDEELNLLERLWQQSKSGEGRIVLLSGEAGIGKSRLLAALEERLADEQLSLRYFCSPHHQDSPLYPITTRMDREAGFIQGDSASDRLRKLGVMLVPTQPTSDDMALFAALLSIPSEGHAPALELSPQQRKMRTFAALLHRLSSLARTAATRDPIRGCPLVGPDIDRIDGCGSRAGANPPCASDHLLSARFRGSLVGSPQRKPHRLSADLIGATRQRSPHRSSGIMSCPCHGLNASSLQSDGVPLFIEELTRAVLEAPELDSSGSMLAVPDTLQASLMARLDRLPGAKMVAQIGSVIGREFPHVLLASAAGLSDADLIDGLHQLAASGLLFQHGAPPDAIYTFKHALVRDVVYDSLPRASRKHLHRKIAVAVEDQLPERAETEPEVVAYHLTQAGLSEPAVKWWSKAGGLALQRSAFLEAIAHLETALKLSEELDNSEEQWNSRLRLQISYGNALRVARGFAAPETKAAFAEARKLGRVRADVPERFSADYGLWSISFLGGDLPTMRELADAFLRDVEDRPELPENGIAHRLCGMTDWFVGDFASARPHLEHALARYDSERDRPLAFRFGQDLAVPPMAYLAMTLWPLGIGDGAKRMAEEAIAHALRTDHVPTIAYAYPHGAVFEMMRRDHVRSAPYLQAYLELAREHGMPMWLAFGVFHEGWLRWHVGAHDEGLTQMYDGLQLMSKQGISNFAPLFHVLLAETEAGAGRYDAALATVDAELARISQIGQYWFLAETHRVRGEIIRLYQPENADAAEEAFVSAIDVARRQSAKQFELRAANSLARLWADQGRSTARCGLLAILTGNFARSS